MPKRTLDSETCLEMVKVGLNPLIEEHYYKFLAFKDRPDLVKLIEGPEWEFKITKEQYEELDKLVKELGDVSEEFKLAFINYKIEDYLPECKNLPTSKRTRFLIERIIKDPPLYFKDNKSFYEKTKLKEEVWKPDYLVLLNNKLFAVISKTVSFIEQLEDGENIESVERRYEEREIKYFPEIVEDVQKLILTLDRELELISLKNDEDIKNIKNKI